MFIFLLSAFLMGCEKKPVEKENILLRYGDRELTYNDVLAKIPDGILSGDSAALFNSIVESWIKDVVLSEMAEERLYDLNMIEQKVKDYRNNLIVSEYLSRMRESHTPKIDDQRIKEYYDKHRKELKLEVPLIKGVFLKINSDAKGKEKIKNLMLSENPQEIDKLEQEWLDRALEYNYFRDKWIDWETISSLIPYRFGNPDAFLKDNKFFETEYEDCSYYLQIIDYLPSGSEQPYEFATTWISGVLTQGDLADFEKALVKSIVSKSIKDKKLEVFGYDPLISE